MYNNFIQDFTADVWDLKKYINLFTDADANYFIQVIKYHDRYILFNLLEKATKQTSVQLVLHRNLLQI